MASIYFSKGDRVAAPTLCATVDKLRQERSTVVQRIKFYGSSNCTKSAEVKLAEVTIMEKRLGELDIESKELFRQVKSSTRGAVHETLTEVVMNVLSTQGNIDAIDAPLDFALKTAQRQLVLANQQVQNIAKIKAAKEVASCNHA